MLSFSPWAQAMLVAPPKVLAVEAACSILILAIVCDLLVLVDSSDDF